MAKFLKHLPQFNNRLLWLTTLAALTLLFLLTAAANLPNYYPLSADDGWIMSASYKLADEGVFGSDLYTGFYNAENHYFIALPVYHLIQAAFFKLLGFGLTQARLPNLISAILLIWVTAALARRHYGRPTALLTAALLIFWRSNLTAAEPRVPLLSYAHNGRYDITAALLVWTAVLLLDHLHRRPRAITALALGLTSGLAALTQFFGGFILLPIALTFWRKWGWAALKQRAAHLTALGFLIATLPYAAYTLANYDAFTGQSILKSDRAQFTDPAFYLDNLQSEPNRYNPIIQWQQNALFTPGSPIRPFGPWLLTAVITTAALTFFYALLKRKETVWSVPWLSLLAFTLCLTLFDQTKAPVYAVLLLPGICLAAAVLLQKPITFLRQLKRPQTHRLALILPIIGFIAVVLLEGANSHRKIIIQALNTQPYAAVGSQIESTLSPDAVILGSERWWPALKAYDYIALNNLWAQWRIAASDSSSPPPDFAQQVRQTAADTIIINNNTRGDLANNPQPLQDQFRDLLDRCAQKTADWTDPEYGRIQIYHLQTTTPC